MSFPGDLLTEVDNNQISEIRDTLKLYKVILLSVRISTGSKVSRKSATCCFCYEMLSNVMVE